MPGSSPNECAIAVKKKYRDGFEIKVHHHAFDEPKKIKNPSLIFVCSMGDLFHEGIPFTEIDRVLQVIQNYPYHTYQLLTKRAERMAEYFTTRTVPRNVWLGVTVENQRRKNRIDILRTLDTPVRFLSCEPLLEDLGELDLENIQWVIVGGESGKAAREMQAEWV